MRIPLTSAGLVAAVVIVAFVLKLTGLAPGMSA